MTSERFKKLDTREFGPEEDLGPQRKGVALLIVDKSSIGSGDPRIWTINELSSSPETQKLAGQVSIPAETRKEDEEESETVFGGLAEFTDSDEVVSHLKINPNKFYAKSAIRVNGFAIDVAIIFYDGPTDAPIIPSDDEEVEPRGWASTRELGLLNGEARSIVGDSISFAQEQGAFDLSEEDQVIPITSLIEDYSSLNEFIEKRDTKTDILLH